MPKHTKTASNLIVVRHKAWPYGDRDGKPVVRHRWDLWDGESYWGGQPPFCTNRCAHAFACAALRYGFRTREGEVNG